MLAMSFLRILRRSKIMKKKNLDQIRPGHLLAGQITTIPVTKKKKNAYTDVEKLKGVYLYHLYMG